MKGIAIGAAFLLLVSLVALNYYFDSLTQPIKDIVSIVGTLASVFGLLIVISQLVEAISLAKSSKMAAVEAKANLMDFLAIVDLAKVTKTVLEIKQLNRAKKFEISLLRMQELREGLLAIKNNRKYNCHIPELNSGSMLTDVNVDISGLEKHLSSDRADINIPVLNDRLDTILNSLNNLSAKLQYEEMT